MNNKKVQVLMAAYNGEAYISEQLDSILAQTYDNIKIKVRDDKSKDSTPDILNDYEKKYINIELVNDGKNKGAINSFFELIINSKDADYYSLSDQDDYWEKNKIKFAVDKLEALETVHGIGVPLLYCSAKTIADEKLNPIYIDTVAAPRLTFGNAVIENMCTGCTCVFNESLRKLIAQKIPEYTVMHDWWIYLLAITQGYVAYDEASSILYRQHGKNVHGNITSGSRLFKHRLNELFRERGQIYRQLEELKKLVRLSNNQMELVEELLASKRKFILRIKIILKKEIFRQRKKDNRIAKFLILTGKL